MIYHGNCHCGRYRFDLRVDGNGEAGDNKSTTVTGQSLIPTVACSCVICTKLGCLWHVLAQSEQLVETSRGTSDSTQLTGDNDAETQTRATASLLSSPLLTTFSSSPIRYAFCSDCGTGVFGIHVKGPLAGQTLVNLHTIRGLNPFDYAKASGNFEGDSSEGPGAPEGDAAAAAEALPTTGACLCGSVSVELRAPLADVPLKEDNCSICTRNAWLGAYPRRAEVLVHGAEHTRDYRFGRRFMGHPFCTTCGAHIFMNVYGPPAEVVARLPEARRAMVAQNLDMQPINVRMLDGIGQYLGQLAVERTDEGTGGYEQDVLGMA
ncbi:MAG: hypothetical protein STHCBS139747_003127 [Sporothrix thermara]